VVRFSADEFVAADGMFSRDLFFFFFFFFFLFGSRESFSLFFWFASLFFPHSHETKIRLELKLVVKRNHHASRRRRRRRRREKREPAGTTPSGGFEKRTVEKRERGTATFERRKEKCTTKFIRSEDDQKR